MKKSLIQFPVRSRAQFGRATGRRRSWVAQILNLLCRRIAFGQALLQDEAQRITNPRYSRIQFCATLIASLPLCVFALMPSARARRTGRSGAGHRPETCTAPPRACRTISPKAARAISSSRAPQTRLMPRTWKTSTGWPSSAPKATAMSPWPMAGSSSAPTTRTRATRAMSATGASCSASTRRPASCCGSLWCPSSPRARSTIGKAWACCPRRRSRATGCMW